VSLGFCIYGVVSGNLFLAISQLVFIVFDSIYLGWNICKFNAYRNYIESTKSIERTLKEFEKFIKMAESEPFKEFEDNGKS
jgi:hypothetical protein